MNREAEICSALIHNRKLRLMSAVADVVGINERELADAVVQLCAEGILRRDRDYLLIASEPKAKAVASRVMPKVENTAAEARVAARMAENAKASAAPPAPAPPAPAPTPVAAAPAAKRNVFAGGIPIPANIVVDYGIPIPSKRLGKVVAPNPFHEQFSTMRVGGSFEVPVPKGFKHRAITELLRKSAYQYQRVMPGLRVTVRTSEDGNAVRLWRDPDGPGKEAPKTAKNGARSSNGIRLPKDKRVGATARA